MICILVFGNSIAWIAQCLEFDFVVCNICFHMAG